MTGEAPEWGIMTGVRPVKKAGELMRANGAAEAQRVLRETFLLSENKARLLTDIYAYQQASLGDPAPESVSVYIGIPFCPTRCLYCSFASNQVKGDEIDRYFAALLEEVAFLGALMKEKNMFCESLYIGGGTPTTLSAEQIARLLSTARREIPGEAQEADGRYTYRELTLEGGRPDTLTPAKLTAAKAGGVNRISINPQTMKDETLVRIGRSHTVAQIREAFAMAREAGFDDINADLIAGLPGEDEHDFARSLEELLTLAPEGITVHTLAVKRASRLKEEDKDYHYRSGRTTQKMLEAADRILRQSDYKPYYLYRQKHMSGAGENTGWCRPGKEGLYNVRIMDEHQSILAAGAGAMSKAYFPEEDRLERAPDLTNYELYIERLGEMKERKRTLFAAIGPFGGR
jgi:oxygen-independent coproporphyrinogen-3 oxidase